MTMTVATARRYLEERGCWFDADGKKIGELARAYIALVAERDTLVTQVEALRAALETYACDCIGRCERMEWLPADNGICAGRRARAALEARHG